VIAAITLICGLGYIVFKAFNRGCKCTFFKGEQYEEACSIYVFLAGNGRFVPVKLLDVRGSMQDFAQRGIIDWSTISLDRSWVLDRLTFSWFLSTLFHNNRHVVLPRVADIPLLDRLKVRHILKEAEGVAYFMIKQGRFWYQPPTYVYKPVKPSRKGRSQPAEETTDPRDDLSFRTFPAHGDPDSEKPAEPGTSHDVL
jgi:hypothetical protein